MKGFAPTPHHPLLTLPTPEQAAAMGAERWAEAMTMRERAIREERQFPLWKCWEPPIWKVCDALIGAPWLPEAEAAAIRQNLGFSQPVTVLYLLGGQRSSKTEYAANRISRIMAHYDDGLSWMFHNTMPASIDTHQKLIWKYLPANLKGKPILSQTTYVAYKDKTGFSDGSLVLENLHKLRFLSYEVALESLQGFNCRIIGADEFVTPDHVETFKARVSVLNGTVLVMLAPITGYTALVQSASDGAELVRSCTAFLNPSDGGARDVGRHLGLTDAEVEELRAWLGRKMAPPFPNVPNCRPQQCAEWLTGGTGQPEVPAGRKFKQVARVQRPRDKEGRSAIVHFYGSDNPYGNPLSLFLLNNQVNEEQGNRIFYGIAKKGIAKKFPKFDEKVHVIDDKAIAKVQGTNYMLEDPGDGRNPFRIWVRVSGSSVYVYREWPGLEPVPDLDYAVPGAWALPDGKHPDGRMGPAQDAFGLGLVDLKREVARAEGWKDAVKWTMEENDREAVKKWSPDNGAREIVARRFIDSRAASNPHVEDDRPVTMLESYADIGLFFELTPGDDIAEGVIHVNDLFSYDQNRPIDALNRPRLFIAKSCINVIFALNTWTGRDGKKGATKDPIDLLRYFALLGLIDMPAGSYDSDGGGSY